MAFTEEERIRIIQKMEKLQRQKTMQQVVKEMARLQEFVDKSTWDAFFASLWWHGGGFFLIGEYFIGITTFVTGYAITLYGVWRAKNTLTYDANGATTGSAPNPVKYSAGSGVCGPIPIFNLANFLLPKCCIIDLIPL